MQTPFLQTRVVALLLAGVYLLCLFGWTDSSACYAQLPALVEPAAPMAEPGSQSTELPSPNAGQDCTPLVDAPLSQLTVDIQPSSQTGQTTIDVNRTPRVCAAPVLSNVATVYLGTSRCDQCQWPIWPGAQFCHRPLYFEEPCLERCGYVRSCQPTKSAAHFFCNAAVLPISMWRQCGTCECTPPAF